MSTDVLNTVAALAGADYRSPDGQDLTPLLRGDALPDRRLFVHFPHYTHQGGYSGTAVYDFPYKLIWWEEDQRYALYDMLADPNEGDDLALELPAVVAELSDAMDEWRRELNVLRVVPNADYTGR